MELSLNVRALIGNHTLEETARMMRAAGFSALDYFIALDEADSPLHRENYRETAENIRATLASHGIRVNQTHAPFRYPAKKWDEEGHFGTFIKALEISAVLGAEICVVHPLHHMEYAGHEEEIFALNMDYYRRLLPYCREYGVKVGIENMWQRHRIRKNITFDTCSTVEEFIRYVDTLDSEYAVACLDIGHVVLPDGRVEIDEFIRRLGHDRLRALHVHDNDYTDDRHLLPYRGRIDFKAVTKALGEIDYAGELTYELAASEFAVPRELAAQAVSYAGAVGAHLIREIEAHRVRP